MRVLIVGAGIAGLTLARLLRQQGILPTVIEKEPQWPRSGFGLSLWPLGSRVLKGLALFQPFVDSSAPLRRYVVADARGRLLHAFDLEQLFGGHDLMRMTTHHGLIQLLAGSSSLKQLVTCDSPIPGSTPTSTAPTLNRANAKAKKSRLGGTMKAVRTPRLMPTCWSPSARVSLSASS
jgi:FAD binding domain